MAMARRSGKRAQDEESGEGGGWADQKRSSGADMEYVVVLSKQYSSIYRDAMKVREVESKERRGMDERHDFTTCRKTAP
jgi:hypothetical protein